MTHFLPRTAGVSASPSQTLFNYNPDTFSPLSQRCVCVTVLLCVCLCDTASASAWLGAAERTMLRHRPGLLFCFLDSYSAQILCVFVRQLRRSELQLVWGQNLICLRCSRPGSFLSVQKWKVVALVLIVNGLYSHFLFVWLLVTSAGVHTVKSGALWAVGRDPFPGSAKGWVLDYCFVIVCFSF